MRDAKLYEIGAGTSEIRRMLIGREIFTETAQAMRRRALLFVAMVHLLGWTGAVDAQPAAKMYRVGVLCPVTCATSDVQAFRRALAALGYKEGANVAL